MNAPPLLSVIIANWNGESLLGKCLESVFQTRVPLEVIVVDDASTDGSVALVQREFPTVNLIRNTVNIGFAKTNNVGARHARGSYFLLLNNDTVLRNDALDILVRYFENHPDAGICGGSLLNTDGSPQHSYGNFPSLGEALAGALLLPDLFPRSPWVKRRAILPLLSRTDPLDVDYIVGADLALRREVYNEFGLFDEQFTAYTEEADLCYRVHRAGRWKIVFVPKAEIVHLYSMSYSDPRRKIQQQMRSNDYFLRKHHGAGYSILVRLLYAWQYLLKMLIRIVRLLTGTGDSRAVKESWYSIRYSLKPH